MTTETELEVAFEPTIVRPGDVVIVRTARTLSAEQADALKRRASELHGVEVVIFSGVDEMAVYRPDRIASADEPAPEPPSPEHDYMVGIRGETAQRFPADGCFRAADHSEYLFTRRDQEEPVARVPVDHVTYIRRSKRTN